MKTQTIQDRIQSIAEELCNNTMEHREQILHEELERNVMYYYECWDIINEARPASFEIEEIGATAASPQQLAFWILHEAFFYRFPNLVQEF